MKLLNKTKMLSVALLLVSTVMASATLHLRLSDGGTTVLVTDNSLDDINPAEGSVVYIGPVGSIWVYNVSAGLSKPIYGETTVPKMDLNSVSFTTNAGFGSSTLTVEFTDTDFDATGPGLVSFAGTTDGTVTATSWQDAGNVPFARTTLLAGQGPFGVGPFDADNSFNVSAFAPYSLTLVATVTHTGIGNTGFDIDLSIAPEPPVESGGACRVTGGGRQQISFPAVSFVTHGGQVGAPVGTETAFNPDSECIQGNWQHVRHAKGPTGGGNFHAKTFDSLMCACLGCPENRDAPVTIGDICNPGDRTCGPEPRKAPANKITFSGVGDYAIGNGKRDYRSVLFRVDIEDRGEPGNTGGKGGRKLQKPYDRHRIRIWILTEAELARLNNPADRFLDFRMAISAGFGTPLKDGAILPDGSAVPNGTAVFGVRAPDIDDGGVMDHGNHQLHPSIKACP